MEFRYKIFLLLAAAAFGLAVARQAYLAGPGGRAQRAEAEKIARFEGDLSAIRGRIFDASGKLAAWSERCYDLIWNVDLEQDSNPARDSEIQNTLRGRFGAAIPPERELRPDRIVKYDLTMRELELADELVQHYPELDIILRWERRHDESAPFSGEVRQEEGMEIGVSGAEAEYDAMLRGVPGRYSVMLDRRGRWIDATFRIVTPAVPGRDIRLSAAAQLALEAEDAHD